MPRDDWAKAKTKDKGHVQGFRPLKHHKIHLRCPKCGRKQSNMPRYEGDPPDAVLVETLCPRCAAGTKDPGMEYFRSDGSSVY